MEITQQQYDHLIHKLDDLESLLKQSMGGGISGDRVGGVELAMEVTGYEKATVYKKIKRGMPHTKDGSKLFFSEKALREWMINPKKNTLSTTKPPPKRPGRVSLLNRF